jgi:uncharacterized protein (DUF4415 family)
MNKKVNNIEDDFEWTDTEFKHSVKINSLPKTLQSKIASRKVRGAQKNPTKVSTTIRLSSEVISSFKATGSGWQTKIDLALKQWLEEHKLT